MKTRSGTDLGQAIAVIRFEPKQLKQKLHLKFEHDHDDLDYVQVARLGPAVSLVRHQGSPSPGTEIVLTAATGLPRAARILAEALRTLGLSEHDLTWRHPRLKRPGRAETLQPTMARKTSQAKSGKDSKLAGATELRQLLRRTRGDRVAAARILKISQKTLRSRLRRSQVTKKRLSIAR